MTSTTFAYDHAARWALNHAPLASEVRDVVAPLFAAWYISDPEEMAYWERCDIRMTRIFECFMEASHAKVCQAVAVETASRDLLAGFNS